MSADFAERRVKMVDGQIRTTDVTSAPLLEAMLVVPREAFVAPDQRDLAYIDEDIRIANGSRRRRALSHGAFAARQADATGRDRPWRIRCSMSAAAPAMRRRSCRGWQGPSSRWKAIRRWPRPRCRRFRRWAATMSAWSTRPLPEGHAAKAPYDVIFIGGSVEKVPALAARPACGGRSACRRRRAGQFGRSPVVSENRGGCNRKTAPLMRQLSHYRDLNVFMRLNSE